MVHSDIVPAAEPNGGRKAIYLNLPRAALFAPPTQKAPLGTERRFFLQEAILVLHRFLPSYVDRTYDNRDNNETYTLNI